MFQLLRLNPRIRSDQRSERTNTFVIIFYHTWFQGHNLHIWLFLEPVDRHNVALTQVAAYLDFIENIADITNDPPVSDDENRLQ